MHSLYILWFYSLQFVINKVIVDAFSLLSSKFLLAKLSLFVYGAIFAELHWQFISICSCFTDDKCLSAVKLPWLRQLCVRLEIS